MSTSTASAATNSTSASLPRRYHSTCPFRFGRSARQHPRPPLCEDSARILARVQPAPGSRPKLRQLCRIKARVGGHDVKCLRLLGSIPVSTLLPCSEEERHRSTSRDIATGLGVGAAAGTSLVGERAFDTRDLATSEG